MAAKKKYRPYRDIESERYIKNYKSVKKIADKLGFTVTGFCPVVREDGER